MALRFGPNKSQLGQRLMAAGASPERTQKFLEQKAFETGQPMGMSTASTKPKALGDPYDDKTQQALKDNFPFLYRPPTSDSPDFKQYFDFVLGKGSYQTTLDKELKLVAPTYRTASMSAANLDKFITTMINDGLDLNTITQRIRDPRAQANLIGYGEKAGQKNILIPFTVDQAIFRATEIYDDYITGKDKANEKLVARLQQDKAYKFGLPDSKLRYGLVTDLSKGLVSITTQPAVAKALALYKQNPKFTSGKEQAFLMKALADVNKANLTPFIDMKNLGERFRNTRP